MRFWSRGNFLPTTPLLRVQGVTYPHNIFLGVKRIHAPSLFEIGPDVRELTWNIQKVTNIVFLCELKEAFYKEKSQGKFNHKCFKGTKKK